MSDTRLKQYTSLVQPLHIIGTQALHQVETTFGSGIDLEAIHSGDLSSALSPSSLYPFHSLVHSQNVGATSRQIAKQFGLSEELVALAEAAGHAHDVIREGTLGRDERQSARWFVEQANKHNIDPKLIDTGRLAILGTIPEIKDFMLVGQNVKRLDFTNAPPEAETIARIVASADLGELFQPTGPLMSHMLLYEILKRQPAMNELISFQTTQLAMTKQYEHPLGKKTPAILTRHKLDVICYTKDLLDEMVNETVTSWQQVIESDRKFILHCKRRR